MLTFHSSSINMKINYSVNEFILTNYSSVDVNVEAIPKDTRSDECGRPH